MFLLRRPTDMRTVSRADVDIERDGSSFTVRVVLDEGFRERGVCHGRSAHCCWSVVDPGAHPLYVWRKSEGRIDAYARSARDLDAAIFTNGPMMGKRFALGGKVTRRRAAFEFLEWAAFGAAGGLALGRRFRFGRGIAAGGTALGTSVAWQRTFSGWTPCGDVVSRSQTVDPGDFDLENERHAWFGRFATEFGSYTVGDGRLPHGVREGLGGLIPLVRGFQLPGAAPDRPRYSADFASLSSKRGVAAWALVPLEPQAGHALEGVLVVLASRELEAGRAADVLRSIGARDAVAMDQRASAMMGTGRRFMVGPPPVYRQAMQTYGLYCR
jgi:hypothetical protein